MFEVSGFIVACAFVGGERGEIVIGEVHISFFSYRISRNTYNNASYSAGLRSTLLLILLWLLSSYLIP